MGERRLRIMSDQLPRPTSFTPDAQAAIVDAVARGNYLATACERAGITYSAFTYWRRLVESGDPNAQAFSDFFAAIKKAVAAAECNALESLRSGMPGWQSQAWFLERRFPKRWGAKAAAEPRRDLKKLSDEELADIAEGKGGGRA